ncbi:hypothetical protein EYE42_11905 [Paracoccus subflavus]|uniref:DUF7282 domain-containing protein n=1 Tax=Paracoccus subflavus TaxID=2528244 RepID=A0A4Q9G305_9RHOB|nr:hypothetical protein [Paracoccus subflavus]TBN38605.1 hypothetical protein EYE42_11905 [Paracoccus subflavus]
MPLFKAFATAVALVPAAAGIAAAENVISADQQEFGQSVIIQSVTAEQDGWLVMHAVQDGQAVVPASIGHTYIKAGTTENVAVALTEPSEGGPLVVMIHVDDGEAGVYEFGPDSTEHDKPVMGDDGPVVAKFEVAN